MRSNWQLQEIDAFLRLQFKNVQGQGLRIVPYYYPLTFLTIDDGTTQNSTLQISANADFVLFEIQYITMTDGAAAWPTGLEVLVTDTSSSNQYTQAPIEVDQYCSGQYFTRNLAYPRKVGGRTTLSVQMRNDTGDDIDYVQLNFSGVLVYSAVQ